MWHIFGCLGLLDLGECNYNNLSTGCPCWLSLSPVGPPDSSTVHFVLPVLNTKKESSSGCTYLQECRRYRYLLHKMLIYNATFWILEIFSKTISSLDVVSIHKIRSMPRLTVTVLWSLGVNRGVLTWTQQKDLQW